MITKIEIRDKIFYRKIGCDSFVSVIDSGKIICLFFSPFFFSSSLMYLFLSVQSTVYRRVSPPGAQVALEQQAYMLLTEAERQTMTYYLQEYQDGHIGVEPLAMALFELFNTHAKVQQSTPRASGLGQLNVLSLQNNILYY